MSVALDRRSLAANLLVALVEGEAGGARRATLDELTAKIGARRGDVRAMVTCLHEEGFLNALTMGLTLSGFALATAMRSRRIRDLRKTGPSEGALVAAAVA